MQIVSTNNEQMNLSVRLVVIVHPGDRADAMGAFHPLARKMALRSSGEILGIISEIFKTPAP